MLEKIFQIRLEHPRSDKVKTLQNHETLIDVFPDFRDLLQHLVEKRPSDYRCLLQNGLAFYLQPVQPGGDDTLDVRGDICLR